MAVSLLEGVVKAVVSGGGGASNTDDFLRIKVVHLDMEHLNDAVFSFVVKENINGNLVQCKPNCFIRLGKTFDSHLKPGRVLDISVMDSENSPSRAQCSITLSALARDAPDDEYHIDNGVISSIYQIPVALQPNGKMTLQVRHFQASKRRKHQINRQPAQKKPKLHLVSGHQLVAKFFSTPTFCSYCSDFLWGFNKQGYQCELCHIAVHKRCHDKVLNTCTRSPVPVADVLINEKGQRVGFSVPHKFKPKNFSGPKFCCHCGQFLWGLYNQGQKCVICKAVVHHKCKDNAAKTCGLKVKEIYETLYTLHRSNANLGSTSTLLAPPNFESLLCMPEDPDLVKPVYEDPTKVAPNLLNNKRTSIACVEQAKKQVAAAMKLAAGKLCLEDFKLLVLLGKGTFGKVYLAQRKGESKDDTSIAKQRLFALKAMNIEFVMTSNDFETTRVERKIAQIVTAAKAPFLVHMLGTFKTEAHLFYVFDFLPGGDLMFHLKKMERFSIVQTRFYAAEIYCALTFLHKHNVVYRDLKLDNVLLDRDGHICLADYGLCKDNINNTNRASTFCGTFDYLAPEIVDQKEYSFSVDWWAFGVMLFEMVTGQTPFYGDTEAELFEEIRNPNLPDLSLIPDQTCASILRQLFERDPTRRLGCRAPEGCGEIKKHSFFVPTIDWPKLERRQVEPPFVPSHDYMRNFDRDFTRATLRLASITNNSGVLTGQTSELLRTIPRDMFANFSFTSPDYTPAAP